MLSARLLLLSCVVWCVVWVALLSELHAPFMIPRLRCATLNYHCCFWCHYHLYLLPLLHYATSLLRFITPLSLRLHYYWPHSAALPGWRRRWWPADWYRHYAIYWIILVYITTLHNITPFIAMTLDYYWCHHLHYAITSLRLLIEHYMAYAITPLMPPPAASLRCRFHWLLLSTPLPLHITLILHYTPR